VRERERGEEAKTEERAEEKGVKMERCEVDEKHTPFPVP
jgi:hypothetical protein